MKSDDITLNTQTVGVAPGTTTVALGDSAPATTELIDPYGSDSRLSGPQLGDDTNLVTGTILDPATWGPASDVAPTPPIRWPLIAMTALTVFAGVLGYGVYARKKNKHGILGDADLHVDHADAIDAALAKKKRVKKVKKSSVVDVHAKTFDPQAAFDKLEAKHKAKKIGKYAPPVKVMSVYEDDSQDDGSWRPQLPKDEGDCLQLGKDHPRYKFGQYGVCLTENQQKTLFGKKRGKKLGCGVFACAYEKTKSKVVKFTRDPEDVAALMKAQKTGVVPKLYSVYEIMQGGENSDGRSTQVYALTLERLRPLGPDERAMFDGGEDEVGVGYRVLDVVDDGRDPNEVCDDGGCGPAFVQTLAAVEKLDSIGIKWRDIHGGNVGFDSKGKLKVLDVGISGTKLEKEPEVLEGAKYAKLRKALGLAKV